MRDLTIAILVSATVAGCSSGPLNTLPSVPSPDGTSLQYDIEVPAELDIITVDFEASTFSSVSGATVNGLGSTTSTVGGRAFLKVHAVHRSTGDRYLLLYEDFSARPSPSHIIRFVPTPGIDIPQQR